MSSHTHSHDVSAHPRRSRPTLSMKFSIAVTTAALAVVTSFASASDQVPGQSSQNVALVGGTVYPVTGEPIENGVVVIRDGKIETVASADGFDVPDGVEEMDVRGKCVYPGLFDPSSQIGLFEIGAVGESVDTSEAGLINPNAQAQVAVNPDSEIIPTVRANGILLAHVHPVGGLVSGQGAIIQLDGWTWEDLTVEAPTGIVASWPSMLPRQAWWLETSVEQQLRQRDERLQSIEDLFDDAERYKTAREAAGLDSAPTSRPASVNDDPDADAPPVDARLEAMVPMLDGSLPILLGANEASQIEAAVAFAKRRGLRPIIVGGNEAWKVADLLVSNDVPVILDGTQRSPGGRDADIDAAFALPHKLREAGVKFAISDDREPAFSRNLPYHAASAVPFGLSQADALASITLWPAEILGVSDRVGSLDAGKDATLFVADGNILEVTSNVTHAWIQGRPVDLSSHHTQLNEKYKQRYGQN